jgi:hypothetical protein
MRGTSSRWVGPLLAVALCVPVATAQGHPADSAFNAGGAYEGKSDGAGIFMQRAAQTVGSFTQVGHNPLLGRGMNAAIAVHDRYVYVGSRTDGKNNNANHAGIMIIDAQNPADPKLAGEIGPPEEGLPGESSRELRVWRSQNILMVIHTNCGGATAHVCGASNRPTMKFYDIGGANATNPVLLYKNTIDTHEFYIWEDPANPRRALMFASSATNNFQIYDLSNLLNADPATRAPVRTFNGAHGFGNSSGSGIHSFSVSNDGKKLYLALLTRGFGIADVSAFTDTDPATNTYRLITPAANRVSWAGPGAHSAVKLWNKNWVYVSDEVYGTITANGHGCPWGWARFIDVNDETRPVVRSEFRLPENSPLTCSGVGAFNPPRTSYSAHNPTLTPNIAFTTWHSGGFQAIDLSDPATPTQLAEFKPQPLSNVDYPGLLEDPRLSSDGTPYLPGRTDNKVVMWSYPVIQDGLIYTVDLRNGLYILKYDGPHQQEVDDITFLEGNSNQGDALCFEPVPNAVAANCSFSTPGGAGGSVAATLALTLGPAASFGTFLPGVAKDYDATSSANVISSAGDAALTVADTSSLAPGHLVNGTFALPSAVQARALNGANQSTAFAAVGSSASPTALLAYPGPIANDKVSLEFRQSIGAGDALRTGAYSKTLTFTLSTTTP